MSSGLKSVASPATGSMFDVRFSMEEMGLEENVAVEEEEVKGQVVLPNKNIRRNKEDILYHLGLSNTSGLQEMFGDVKFVCMGGSALRAHRLAEKLQEALNIKYPPGAGIVPIGKTERFSLYKMGPVISVSHGMGMPSMSILLHEITKLLYHAKASNVVFIRVGTCGGVGCPPGTVILTTEGVNAKLQSIYKMVNLGKTRKFATNLDASLIEEGLAAAEQEPRIPCVSGRTYGADDFYEGQGRLDGALIDYTREERDTWMAQLKDANVRNIEMEAPCFAAFCNRAGIRAMICCAALLNRLLGDQVTATPEQMNQYTERALDLAIRVIQRRLASDAASSSSSSN